MNPLSKYLTLVTVMALALCSCKKIVPANQGNSPGSIYSPLTFNTPVAIAFYDSLSNQPVGTKFLTGKYSTDKVKITSWKWAQVYGPSTANIARPDSME